MALILIKALRAPHEPPRSKSANSDKVIDGSAVENLSKPIGLILKDGDLVVPQVLTADLKTYCLEPVILARMRSELTSVSDGLERRVEGQPAHGWRPVELLATNGQGGTGPP